MTWTKKTRSTSHAQGSWEWKPEKTHPKTGKSKTAYIACNACSGWKWAHRTNVTHCDRCGLKYVTTAYEKNRQSKDDAKEDSKDLDKNDKEENAEEDGADKEDKGETLSEMGDPGTLGVVTLLTLVAKDPAMNSIPGIPEVLKRLEEIAVSNKASPPPKAREPLPATLAEARKRSADATKVWKTISQQMGQKQNRVQKLETELTAAKKDFKVAADKYNPATTYHLKCLKDLDKLTQRENGIMKPPGIDVSDDGLSSVSSVDVTKCDFSVAPENDPVVIKERERLVKKQQAKLNKLLRDRKEAQEVVENKSRMTSTLKYVKAEFANASKLIQQKDDDIEMIGTQSQLQKTPTAAVTPHNVQYSPASPAGDITELIKAHVEPSPQLLGSPLQPLDPPPLVPQLPPPAAAPPSATGTGGTPFESASAPVEVSNGFLEQVTAEDVEFCLKETQAVKGEGKGKGSHRHEEYSNDKPDDTLDDEGNLVKHR